MEAEFGDILVTGANGFLGSALVSGLSSSGFRVLAGVRSIREEVSREYRPSIKEVVIGDLAQGGDYAVQLEQCSAVVHCAARVHMIDDSSTSALEEYRRINVQGTVNLARQASLAGVRRFIFISTIKVNGEQTECGQPFTPEDQSAPTDAYGISKCEAELRLWEISAESGMELVILRPPLVYGPGVKGNFANMVNLVAMGVPLPLGAVNNRRSLVALDNMVDLIVTCICHPAAANQVFLVSDGHDLSTTELLRGVAGAMGKPARLIPVPAKLLFFVAKVLGRDAIAQRLLNSLQVDISKARKLLGWEPPVSVDEGLRRCFGG